MENKQLLTCDWLQFHATHEGFNKDTIVSETDYKVIDCEHGTRVFARVFKVAEKARITRSHRDEPLAVIAWSPHSSILQHNMCIVKIENKILYQQGAYQRVAMMLRQLRIHYVGVTRLDLCVDLFRFANDMTPIELMRAYRKNKAIKRGSRRYCQWMTAPYSPSKIAGVITHDLLSDEHIPHAVSWGGPNSDVHVKLYNKSKEIRESSDKRYISSWHRNNGLVGGGDVWRVEISFQRRSRYLFDKEQDCEVPINLDCALTPTYQREVFSALAARHFSFKAAEVGKSMRSCQSLQLFSLGECGVLEPASHESRPIAGRTAKVCANYLEKLTTSIDWDTITTNCPYPKELIEETHKVMVDIYDGLVYMTKNSLDYSANEYKQVMERIDWLKQWNVVNATLDGVPIDDIVQHFEEMGRREQLRVDMLYRITDIQMYLSRMATDDMA